MSILSDINTTINDTTMLLWYKEEYIPFVIDHIDDIVEVLPSGGFWYYMAYIPLDYHPNDISCTREICVEWLLNNDKIRCVETTDDTIAGKYCYSGNFLEDSGLIAHVFNTYLLKTIQDADNYFKNTMWYADSDSMTDLFSNKPYTWTMKVDYADYAKHINSELSKVYYPIS